MKLNYSQDRPTSISGGDKLQREAIASEHRTNSEFAHEGLEMRQRQRVIVVVERDLIPLIGKLGGESKSFGRRHRARMA